MIPYMVGKLAPNSTHFTRGLVKQVPGRGYFRAVPSQNGDICVTSPPPPPIVERLCTELLSGPGLPATVLLLQRVALPALNCCLALGFQPNGCIPDLS